MSDVNSVPYVKAQKEHYKNKHALLINSLIWGGLGFVLVGLLSIGYSFLIRYYLNNNFNDSYFIGAGLASFIFMIVAVILNMKWSFNITEGSWGLVIGVWILDIFLLTGIVAPLVTVINDPWLIFTVIAVTGGIFTVMGLIGYAIMNSNMAIAMSKVAMFILIAIFVFQLVFMLTFSFMFSNTLSIYYLIFDIAFLVITGIMIGLTFYSISNASIFYNNLTKQEQMKLSLYFGLRLLITFVIMFVYLLRFIASFRSN